MKFISIIFLLLLAVSANSVTIDILSEHSCPVEMMRWSPIRIDSCQFLESGGMRISTNRAVPSGDSLFNTELWTIVIDSAGCPVSCEVVVLDIPDNRLILSFSQLGGSSEMWMIACTEQNDTVWTCALEGTDEFSNYQVVTKLPDGGYLINSPPDCHSTYTEIQSVSSAGEMIFHYSLGTCYLLDLPGVIGEVSPGVRFLRKTSSGDILVGGTVSQFLTSPNAWFVCLLDGDTGNPRWKTTGYALGMAGVYEAIEASSGLIVAVGATARIVVPEGYPRSAWGSKLPFITVLDCTGAFQKTVVCDLDLADWFYSIIETDPLESEFLIAGEDTTSNELVLLRTIILNEQDN